MKNKIFEQSCTCPQCGYEANESEFKPKQYTSEGNQSKSPIGLEIFISKGSNGGSSEEDNA